MASCINYSIVALPCILLNFYDVRKVIKMLNNESSVMMDKNGFGMRHILNRIFLS